MRNNMRYLLIIFIFITSLNASNFSIGDQIQAFTLPDQFGKEHTIDSSIKTIIVSFEKATGADMNKFLNAHEPNYLKNHHAVFIANISQMPSLITKLFAMPKMKKYKHTILIINDEDNHQFLHYEDKIVIYTLKNGVISEINFVYTAKEVQEKL